MVTSLMVSYTRARAEALIGKCKVGFMERPERVVLIIIGALFERWDAMAPVLWVLAVISTITVVHRVIYTYQQTRHMQPVAEVKHIVQPSEPIQKIPQPIAMRESRSSDPRPDLPAPNAPRV
jgi:CDP-diacylglycerol--glycerol-3-phosphate 3-phosphatidyltransferase